MSSPREFSRHLREQKAKAAAAAAMATAMVEIRQYITAHNAEVDNEKTTTI